MVWLDCHNVDHAGLRIHNDGHGWTIYYYGHPLTQRIPFLWLARIKATRVSRLL